MFKTHANLAAFILSTVAIVGLTACGGGSSAEQLPPQPPVATAPDAAADRAVVTNDSTIEVDVLVNDKPGSAGALTITAVTSATLGQTSIVNNKIRYQPPANFLGNDSFSYTVASGSLNASATVTIEGQQSLILKGMLADATLTEANISVEVNGETFTALTDSQGYFSLPVLFKTLPNAQLLRLKASGLAKNNQSSLTFSSVLESPSQLLARRNANSTVDMTVLPALKLDVLTTAQDIIFRKIIGKNSFTFSEMRDAEISVVPVTLVNTAAAIQWIIDDAANRLPAGYTNIEALVSNQSAFDQFLRNIAQGSDSTLLQARTKFIANHRLDAGQMPAIGDYLRVVDTQIFLPEISFENLTLKSDAVTITTDNLNGQFFAGTKNIQFQGNLLELVDPELKGYLQQKGVVYARSWLPDELSKTAWTSSFCPDLINIDVFDGYQSIKIIQSNPRNFIAEISTFRRQTPVAGSECGNVYPQSRTTKNTRIVKFVRKNELISALPFDLSISKKWILPDPIGRVNDNDLFTLNDDGTFDTLTGTHQGAVKTWALSADKKVLTLTLTDSVSPSKNYQMDVQINRKLDHGYSVLATFKNSVSPEPFSQLRATLPVAGPGVIDLLTASAGKNKMIISAFNSRAYEWQGRTRLIGDWYGWILNQENRVRVPQFTCDNVIMYPGDDCFGKLAYTPIDTLNGVWEVKNNELHVVSADRTTYRPSYCQFDQPCNLRVIVPLYEKDGLITGYEFNKLPRDVYLVKPRLIQMTIQDLPAQLLE